MRNDALAITIAPRPKQLSEWYGSIVSINKVFDVVPVCVLDSARPFCPLFFDDVEHENQERFGYTRATAEQIAKLMEFTDHMKNSVFVHCEAGISRSSAAAMIIAVSRGASEEQALTLLDENKHWPNLWMLELADQIGGWSLHEHACQWRVAVREKGVMA